MTIQPDKWGLSPADWERIEEIGPHAQVQDLTFVGRLIYAAYQMRQQIESDERRYEEAKHGK